MWAVLVPEALAYATIAGVSPVVGLYPAPGALIFYAAFGSSKHLVVGPMAAMLGVLIFDKPPGLIIGVLDSLALLIYRVSRPHVAVLGEIPGSGGAPGYHRTLREAVAAARAGPAPEPAGET